MSKIMHIIAKLRIICNFTQWCSEHWWISSSKKIHASASSLSENFASLSLLSTLGRTSVESTEETSNFFESTKNRSAQNFSGGWDFPGSLLQFCLFMCAVWLEIIAYLLFSTRFSGPPGQVAQRKLPAAKPHPASGATCPPVDRPPVSNAY